jgi:hypothetical protein
LTDEGWSTICSGAAATVLLALVTGCADGATGEAAFPVGTYELVVSADEPRPGCINGAIHFELDVGPESMTRFRYVGGSRGLGQRFDYSVFRDTITITNRQRTMTGRFQFDGEQLVIDEIDSDRCEDASDWEAGPFVLTSETDAP